MALLKETTLDNGIVVSYHRVKSINNIINKQTRIEIASYLNENERQKEIDYYNVKSKSSAHEELTEEEIEMLNKGLKVFIHIDELTTSYDKDMNVDNAYEYLKTLDKYKDSEDV